MFRSVAEKNLRKDKMMNVKSLNVFGIVCAALFSAGAAQLDPQGVNPRSISRAGGSLDI